MESMQTIAFFIVVAILAIRIRRLQEDVFILRKCIEHLKSCGEATTSVLQILTKDRERIGHVLFDDQQRLN